MKKLMFVAALATSFAAVAGTCKPEGEHPAEYCATVYNLSINLKTPKGVAGACAADAASTCKPGAKADVFVRTPSTYKLKGILADCACGCEELKDFIGYNIAIWNTSEKLYSIDTTWTVDILHVLAAAQNKAEIGFTLKAMIGDDPASGLEREFELAGAGFGTFNKKTGIYTSFSGNVVGTVSKVYYPKAVWDEEEKVWYCPEAGYWLCTDLVCANIALTEASVAYGSFSLKYNASASKKLAQGKGWPTIPAYVKTPVGWVYEAN